MSEENNNWMPIETAPKIPSVIDENGIEEPYAILLYSKGRKNPAIGGWLSSFNKYWTLNYGYEEKYTHWMPLPKLPTK